MPDNAAQLYKSGAISTAAYNKILAATRVQPSKMAEFEHKGKDEGQNRDRGDRSVAGNRHIDTKQSKTARGVSTPPSRGGGMEEGAMPRTRQIDQGEMQRPEFPAGAKVKGSNKSGAKASSNKKSKARVPREGGYYGGGGQDTQ